MKAATFDYRAPGTLADALAQLAADPDCAPLAGGQSLLPLLSRRERRPSAVLDLNRLAGLDEIRATADTVRIGAMVRLHELETRADLQRLLPVLGQAVRHVAHRQIRLRATLGGSLCHADPAAELPAVAVALGARLRLRSQRGDRVVPAADFFTGSYATSRQPDELLAEVEFGVPAAFRFEFAEVSRRGEAGFPLVGLCLGVRLESGRVAEARLAAAGMAPAPARLTAAEQLLAGRRLSDPLDQVADAALAACQPASDLHGSADYRRQLLRVLIRRTVAAIENSQQAEGEAPA